MKDRIGILKSILIELINSKYPKERHGYGIKDKKDSNRRTGST